MCDKFTFDELSNTTKSEVKIDEKINIETYKFTITGHNIISIQVGTTGEQGGNTGCGGRTYLKIEDEASTDIMAKVIVNHNKEENNGFSPISSLELRLGGDNELHSFIEALEFAVKILKSQRHDKKNDSEYNLAALVGKK